MKDVSNEMYKSERAEIVFHAEELLNASNIAIEWALEIEKENAKYAILSTMMKENGKNNG